MSPGSLAEPPNSVAPGVQPVRNHSQILHGDLSDGISLLDSRLFAVVLNLEIRLDALSNLVSSQANGAGGFPSEIWRARNPRELDFLNRFLNPINSLDKRVTELAEISHDSGLLCLPKKIKELTQTIMGSDNGGGGASRGPENQSSDALNRNPAGRDPPVLVLENLQVALIKQANCGGDQTEIRQANLPLAKLSSRDHTTRFSTHETQPEARDTRKAECWQVIDLMKLRMEDCREIHARAQRIAMGAMGAIRLAVRNKDLERNVDDVVHTGKQKLSSEAEGRLKKGKYNN
ncbi:hypothetical protein PSHT_00422 [Puccinia striiformis]|uniref:Uncharacterized protein n=2 Tax=Puccinia striiformis TaxID=27350 RepID=A0A0L0V9Y7_9BASI|nr:hypothetical protein PSTG_10697 [Puccinia striiformis f. sp. tritici PST-78]POW23217.1 hypothetical protein PSHT_00422 [Puccinia striiformis]